MSHTANGYRTSKDGNRLIVHDVEIFCACERGEGEDRTVFDEAWVSAALVSAKRKEAEGYFPPLHVRHHGKGTDDVHAAGMFRITRTEPITMGGKRRLAIFADLIVTDPTIQAEVMTMRYPYRSVEIFDAAVPSIDSLALLDHEAPYLELPVLAVAGAVNTGVACFQRGAGAQLLFFEADPMTTKTVDATKEPFGDGVTTPATFADDGPPKKDKDEGDDMEGGEGGPDIAAVAKAIESGEISVADMDVLLAAIQNQKSASDAPDEPEAAPAAVPGGEAMQKGEMSEQFAALQGANEGLTARIDAMDAEKTRTTEVADALQRLAGRPLGSDLETRLQSFHSEHGAKAFAAYVDSMAQTVAPSPTGSGREADFLGQGGNVSEVAMKYQDQGTDAVDKAAKFSAEWHELREHGSTRVSEERYIELNMARTA